MISLSNVLSMQKVVDEAKEDFFKEIKDRFPSVTLISVVETSVYVFSEHLILQTSKWDSKIMEPKVSMKGCGEIDPSRPEEMIQKMQIVQRELKQAMTAFFFIMFRHPMSQEK